MTLVITALYYVLEQGARILTHDPSTALHVTHSCSRQGWRLLAGGAHPTQPTKTLRVFLVFLFLTNLVAQSLLFLPICLPG